VRRRPHAEQPGAGGDPPRLLRSGAPAADLLRSYARRTTPGDRGGVAAWYRLRARVEAAPEGGLAAALGRWRRTWSLTGALTVALGILVLVKLVPPPHGRAAAAMGGGGTEGACGIEGAGGMRGSPGIDRSPGV
jgi:hypothetical protein